MHYLVTGHTGFKGAWLVALLRSRGHEVSGLALDPVPDALYTRAGLAGEVAHDLRIDIRDAAATAAGVAAVAPDVVLHLAAQPLVRASYEDPRTTFETNAMGTLNVLEAVQNTPSVKAHVVITTDKVYRNVNQEAGYVESDPLGGDDPYSSSKAMADLLTQSWVTSFPGIPTAIARAGNVIGGGDVSRDRLLPDLLAAYGDGRAPVLRYPKAVRPWQHVLCLCHGYLTLLAEITRGNRAVSDAWNFGPDRADCVTVEEMLKRMAQHWSSLKVEVVPSIQHEAKLLMLDSAKARSALAWQPAWTLAETLAETTGWYRGYYEDPSAARAITLRQIDTYRGRIAAPLPSAGTAHA